MKRILDKRNMTEEDWQEYRRTQKGIGGSDVAVILGLSKYKSAFTLWLEKTGQISPQKVENQYVEWGTLLEPVIREKFKRETGFKVFQNNFVLQHDQHEFMIANLDGEVIDPSFGGERGILEIKTAGERKKDEWIDGPPDYYMTQIQHYLGVTGYLYAYVAVLIGGNEFKYFLIHRDDYIIDQIISAEANFMWMVENMVSPEITANQSDTDWLSSAFPNDNGEELLIAPEYEKMAFRYNSLQEEIKMLQEASETIKNQIKLLAGENKILTGENLRISIPTVKKVTFDSKAFANDYPDLYQQYKTKESSYRSFSVKLQRRE